MEILIGLGSSGVISKLMGYSNVVALEDRASIAWISIDSDLAISSGIGVIEITEDNCIVSELQSTTIGNGYETSIVIGNILVWQIDNSMGVISG